MTRRRADPKTAHLPLIGFREIEAGKIELARAILAVGEDEALPALQVLTAMNRAKVIAEPLPYLAVREDLLEGGEGASSAGRGRSDRRQFLAGESLESRLG